MGNSYAKIGIVSKLLLVSTGVH